MASDLIRGWVSVRVRVKNESQVPRAVHFRKNTRGALANSYQNGTAQQRPGLNPHLTKSRLNDALRLCEMVHRNSGGSSRAVQPSNVLEDAPDRRAGCRGNKVEAVWMQGG